MLRFLACALILAASFVPVAAAPEATSGQIERLYREALARADEIRPQQRGLDPERMRELFTRTSTNPVAAVAAVPHYDPDGYIGFCFGRAMTAHLIARSMGVAPASVKKLFIVGDMRQATATQTQWRFHVTTVVKGQGESEWFAIDPIMHRVMPMKAWIDHVRRTWDLGRKAHFYVVPSSVVIPDVRQVPPIAEETGERIIELSFRPHGKPGFQERPDLGYQCYEATQDAAHTYFLDAEEPVAPFDFAGITINTRTITYRNYFFDLMGTLGETPGAGAGPVRVTLPGLSAYVEVDAPTTPRSNPGSMDFGKILGLR